MLARINTFICEKVFHTIYSSKRGFSRMKAFLVIIRQNSLICCALALCDVGRAYDGFIFQKVITDFYALVSIWSKPISH